MKRYVSFKDQMKVLFISLLALTIWFFLLWLKDRNKPDQILLHKGLTSCKVLGWKMGLGRLSTGYIEYQFTYHDMIYTEENYARNCNYQDLTGKRILVIFDTLDPGDSRMLISNKDFDEAHVPVPDSLKWILKLCNN